jgi:hypothetical protein
MFVEEELNPQRNPSRKGLSDVGGIHSIPPWVESLWGLKPCQPNMALERFVPQHRVSHLVTQFTLESP